MSDKIEIRLDALCPPLKNQLPLSDDASDKFEALRRSVNILRTYGYLTMAEADNVERRLVKDIIGALK